MGNGRRRLADECPPESFCSEVERKEKGDGEYLSDEYDEVRAVVRNARDRVVLKNDEREGGNNDVRDNDPRLFRICNARENGKEEDEDEEYGRVERQHVAHEGERNEKGRTTCHEETPDNLAVVVEGEGGFGMPQEIPIFPLLLLADIFGVHTGMVAPSLFQATTMSIQEKILAAIKKIGLKDESQHEPKMAHAPEHDTYVEYVMVGVPSFSRKVLLESKKYRSNCVKKTAEHEPKNTARGKRVTQWYKSDHNEPTHQQVETSRYPTRDAQAKTFCGDPRQSEPPNDAKYAPPPDRLKHDESERRVGARDEDINHRVIHDLKKILPRVIVRDKVVQRACEIEENESASKNGERNHVCRRPFNCRERDEH